MAARQTRVMPVRPVVSAAATVLLAAALVGLASRGCPDGGLAHQTPARARIVSLVPAATEILFAIGAGPDVVGVSTFDAFPPEVRTLPRVGALLDPDTERILALRPSVVVVYASQEDAIARFERAGIRTFVTRHGGIDAVFETMQALGGITGRAADADRLVRDLRARIDTVRARVQGRPRPRTLVVIGRQPTTLRNVYASGGIGFIHEMLGAAGGLNVFADVARESVQPTHEVLLARAPDVILELNATGPPLADAQDESRRAWAILPSIPAVRLGRVRVLVGEPLVVPGPRLAQGVDMLAQALHP